MISSYFIEMEFNHQVPPLSYETVGQVQPNLTDELRSQETLSSWSNLSTENEIQIAAFIEKAVLT